MSVSFAPVAKTRTLRKQSGSPLEKDKSDEAMEDEVQEIIKEAVSRPPLPNRKRRSAEDDELQRDRMYGTTQMCNVATPTSTPAPNAPSAITFEDDMQYSKGLVRRLRKDAKNFTRLADEIERCMGEATIHTLTRSDAKGPDQLRAMLDRAAPDRLGCIEKELATKPQCYVASTGASAMLVATEEKKEKKNVFGVRVNPDLQSPSKPAHLTFLSASAPPRVWRFANNSKKPEAGGGSGSGRVESVDIAVERPGSE